LRNLTQDNITQAVIARLAGTPDARLREVMTSLVQHLHAFARDVRPTGQEWSTGLGFLSQAAREGGGAGQGLALLSDTLGLSMLTVAMNTGKPPACTEVSGDEPCVVRGRVLGEDGEPVAGAVVEVDQAGVLRAGPDGRFQFRCEPCGSVPLPQDGPVGELLRATVRQAWRPQHLRFTVQANGYQRLVSDVFSSADDGDCALEYDFVLSPAAQAGP
jgi:hydroxyquinol 1,2-dioxygenase